MFYQNFFICLSVLFAFLSKNVFGHTMKICVEVVDQTVTFYGGSWHGFQSNTVGGVILSNGASGNGRYDFTSTLYDDNEVPSGVDLTNFACTTCVTSSTVGFWQKVVIDGLTCDSTYDVTTTTDTVVEWPACTFPSITIPPCGCDETMDIKCRASGDPHFTTWDNSRHHFQGVGYYDYITKCSDDVFFPFTITARQEECGRWAPMTCITEVRVTLSDGRVIIYPRNGNVDPKWMSGGASAVGDDQTFADGTFSVQPGSFSGTFEDDGTDITIMFTYHGAYFQAMTSGDCMEDRICGVCGNVNGDPTDDFEKRDGTIVDNTGSGTWRVPEDVWDNTFCFGDSWCNEQFTNNPDCTPTPPPSQPPTECLDAAEEHCTDVFDLYCDYECSDDELDFNAWLEDCKFDSCAASNNNLGDYGLGDAINNGFFDSSLDECRYFCDIPDHHPFLSECGPCNDMCKHLTNEYGCADDECLDTCKYCISGIDWYDYEGGQSNQCQCHNNGCDQCQDGWFKIDYDFPCQSCKGMLGCLHCTDFWGCQQCMDGYTMVESNTCGENSNINTGNTKFHYCVPNNNMYNGKCKIGDPGFDDYSEPTTTPEPNNCPVTPCGNNPCDCSYDNNCNDCQSWGCNSCNYGYYKQSFGHPCVSCYDTFDGKCTQCTDWQGCTECVYGYHVAWDSDCGTNVCVQD